MSDKEKKKKEKYKDFDWRAEDKNLKTSATEKVKEEKKEKKKKKSSVSPEAQKLYSMYKNKMSNRPRRNKYSDKRKKFMSRFASIESI
jgi:hypothetical protein|tara:strand:- start:373 stop:636 length:264 start_codon:yes stop_codon:yes gene_type:complete